MIGVRRVRFRVDRVVVYATLAIFAAFAAFPLVLIVSTALKQPADARRDPFGLFTTTTLQNFADAWVQGKFGHFFLNTVWITGATVLGVVILSVAVALAVLSTQWLATAWRAWTSRGGPPCSSCSSSAL